MASFLKRATPAEWRNHQMRRPGKRKRSEALKRRRRRENCYCGGWWWAGPHRRTSMASEYTFHTKGTAGCYWGKPPAFLVALEAARG